MSITCVTVITDKFVEVDGALILSPSLHQCSILREFKARQNYTVRREVETRMGCHRESTSGTTALKALH